MIITRVPAPPLLAVAEGASGVAMAAAMCRAARRAAGVRWGVLWLTVLWAQGDPVQHTVVCYLLVQLCAIPRPALTATQRLTAPVAAVPVPVVVVA